MENEMAVCSSDKGGGGEKIPRGGDSRQKAEEVGK